MSYVSVVSLGQLLYFIERTYECVYTFRVWLYARMYMFLELPLQLGCILLGIWYPNGPINDFHGPE